MIKTSRHRGGNSTPLAADALFAPECKADAQSTASDPVDELIRIRQHAALSGGYCCEDGLSQDC